MGDKKISYKDFEGDTLCIRGIMIDALGLNGIGLPLSKSLYQKISLFTDKEYTSKELDIIKALLQDDMYKIISGCMLAPYSCNTCNINCKFTSKDYRSKFVEDKSLKEVLEYFYNYHNIPFAIEELYNGNYVIKSK